MRGTLALGVSLVTLLLSSLNASGQPSGAQAFNDKALNAFVSTPTSQIFIAGQQSETPTGTTGFAVINVFDSNGTFQACESANFELRVTPGSIGLTFNIESGFQCDRVGERIDVKCSTTADSGVFHNITSGTSFVFGQRYTTHGNNDSYNNLACTVAAFGTTLNAQGSAGTQRTLATP